MTSSWFGVPALVFGPWRPRVSRVTEVILAMKWSVAVLNCKSSWFILAAAECLEVFQDPAFAIIRLQDIFRSDLKEFM